MKRIFTFALAAVAALSVSAARRTVWTGNEPISWNSEVYKGTQFETPSGIFSGLQQGDTLLVEFTNGMDEPQYVMTYKAGDGWNWTDLTITQNESVLSYVVESSQIATEIADRGLIFRGQGYNITSITVAEVNNDDPDWVETEVWKGNEPISWNTEVYDGTQFETPSGIFTRLKKDNEIRIACTAQIDDPQYVLTYKAGDSWTWTDLTITVKNGVMTYTVESNQIAQEIADRGLIFRGQGYNITAISVYAPKGGTTAIENAASATLGGSQKIFRNGQLYIMYKGTMYDVRGNVVK